MWETAQVANDPPSVDYRKVMDTEEGVLEWLLKIVRGAKEDRMVRCPSGLHSEFRTVGLCHD